MATKTAKSSRPRTQGDLADALKISRRQLIAHFNGGNCPVARRGPWTDRQVTLMADYIASFQDNRSSHHCETEASWEQRVTVVLYLKTKRMRKLKLEREILEGSYLSQTECEAALIERARYQRADLEELPAQVAATSVGLHADEIADTYQAKTGTPNNGRGG